MKNTLASVKANGGFGVQKDMIGKFEITDLDHDGLYDIYEIAGMMMPNEKFVEIWEGGKKYYGGNQEGYVTNMEKDGACGTVAVANITAYMTRFHKE